MSLSKNVDEVSDLALTVTLGDSWVVSAHSNERWRDGPTCSRSGHIPDLLRLLIAWKLQNLPLIKCFFDQSDIRFYARACKCIQASGQTVIPMKEESEKNKDKTLGGTAGQLI